MEKCKKIQIHEGGIPFPRPTFHAVIKKKKNKANRDEGMRTKGEQVPQWRTAVTISKEKYHLLLRLETSPKPTS